MPIILLHSVSVTNSPHLPLVENQSTTRDKIQGHRQFADKNLVYFDRRLSPVMSNVTEVNLYNVIQEKAPYTSRLRVFCFPLEWKTRDNVCEQILKELEERVNG